MRFAFAVLVCFLGLVVQPAVASESSPKYKFYKGLSAQIDEGFASTQEGIDSDVRDMKKYDCAANPNKEPCPEYASEIKTLKMDLKFYQKKKDCMKFELEAIKASSDSVNQLASDVKKISDFVNKTPATKAPAECAAFSKEWADKYAFYVQANQFVSDKEASKSFPSKGADPENSGRSSGASGVQDKP